MASQDFVGVESIAGYCMVSRSTVRRWIADGKLGAFKLPGGHYRISVADFNDFLKRYNIPVCKELQEHNSN